MFIDVSSFVSRCDVVRLAAFGVVDSVLCQFADEIAFAVHVAIDEVVLAVVVEEVLPVLRCGMLGCAYIQGVDIAEGTVDVVCHTDHLAVVLH